MSKNDAIHGRLRVSGVFLIAGLLVEALCLVWSRPLAFVVFAAVGGASIGAGVLIFLYSLVSPNVSHPAEAGRTGELDSRS